MFWKIFCVTKVFEENNKFGVTTSILNRHLTLCDSESVLKREHGDLNTFTVAFDPGNGRIGPHFFNTNQPFRESQLTPLAIYSRCRLENLSTYSGLFELSFGGN